MKRYFALLLALLLALSMVACHKEEQAGPLLAMGGGDVPVGSYTRKIFDYYGIDEVSVAHRITYGSNAKEVTTAVAEGTADCGVVYATDAYAAGLTVVDTATAEQCGQVIYPAAVMKSAPNAQAARHFVAYLTGAEATAVFEKAGFTALSSTDERVDAAGDSGEVIVFAAASLTEALNDIAAQYKAVAPDVKLRFSFDSSGILRTQIEEGADCDLFLSAAPGPMNGLELVAAETRIDLLENKVVLCVAENSRRDIQSFERLAQLLQAG